MLEPDSAVPEIPLPVGVASLLLSLSLSERLGLFAGFEGSALSGPPGGRFPGRLCILHAIKLGL